VWGDRARLERVLQNVIGNAVKYSPDGAPVQVTASMQEGWDVVVVRDSGVGIPADELPHIFTHFYRASTARGFPGSGLGLAGAKTIVEQHGGHIRVQSAVGQGTTVVVSLPCALPWQDG
jgi:signal transduction histidine kinase